MAQPLRRVPSLPGRLGVAVVAAGAVLGTLATVAARAEPGALLGGFVIAATVAAALLVHPRAVYQIIPAPALAYAAAAVIAGLAHDHSSITSHAALAVSAAQWIAGGFVTMTAATALAVVVTAARWLWRIRRAESPGHAGPWAATRGGR